MILNRYVIAGIASLLILSFFSLHFTRSFTGFAVYNLCRQYYGEKVSLQEFERILTAVHYGNCNGEHALVNITFSMNENELKNVADLSGIPTSKVIIRDISEDVVPFGGGYLIVYGHKGDYILNFNDHVEIFREGEPNPDTIVLVRAEEVILGEDVLRFGGIFLHGDKCKLFFSGPNKVINFYREMKCSELKGFTVTKAEINETTGFSKGDFRLIILSDIEEVGRIIGFTI